MRIVVGVDPTQHYLAALNLLDHLRLSSPEVELVHVIERFQPHGALEPLEAGTSLDLILQIEKLQNDEADRLLEEASKHPLAASAKKVRLNGFISNELCRHANASRADLVAVGCTQKGRIEAFFVGGVGRKLVINANQSMLVAKRMPEEPWRGVAVLATDHSEYAGRCMDELIRLAPRGLKKVVVLTAYSQDLSNAIHKTASAFPVDLSKVIEEKLHALNRGLIEKLAPLGCKCESLVVCASPNRAIGDTVREQHADLLILGAQGHGLVDRLTLGSVAFRQVVSEPSSVLVLRV
ncbi:MAG: universal stress protein [Planctomycetota bacterium]